MCNPKINNLSPFDSVCVHSKSKWPASKDRSIEEMAHIKQYHILIPAVYLDIKLIIVSLVGDFCMFSACEK